MPSVSSVELHGFLVLRTMIDCPPALPVLRGVQLHYIRAYVTYRNVARKGGRPSPCVATGGWWWMVQSLVSSLVYLDASFTRGKLRKGGFFRSKGSGDVTWAPGDDR